MDKTGSKHEIPDGMIKLRAVEYKNTFNSTKVVVLKI